MGYGKCDACINGRPYGIRVYRVFRVSGLGFRVYRVGGLRV